MPHPCSTRANPCRTPVNAPAVFRNSILIEGALTCSALSVAKAMNQPSPDYKAADAAFQRDRDEHKSLETQFRQTHTDATATAGPLLKQRGGVWLVLRHAYAHKAHTLTQRVWTRPGCLNRLFKD